MLTESFVGIFLLIVPIPLIFLTAVYARLKLYHRLGDLAEHVRLLINGNTQAEGNKHRLVNALEVRYREASKRLDRVNTEVLIDQLYKRETLQVLGGLFRYEQAEQFCRVIPNLMIGYGLLGTFLGITKSLISLNGEIALAPSTLIDPEIFREPLQGMGIAFVTSLTGLLFSIILTLINVKYNVSIVQYQLISLLEDYLDNIYQAKSHSNRIDRLVQNMADRFETFLDRFGQTVRGAVEASLKEKLDEIHEANLTASKIAQNVFGRLADASGTIQIGADRFQDASREFIEASRIFQDSQFAKTLATSINDLLVTQQGFAQSTDSLVQAVQGIGQSVIELQHTSHQLSSLREQVLVVNQNSLHALTLHQANQESLRDLIPEFQSGSQSFRTALEILEKSQQKVDHRVDSLSEIQIELSDMVKALNNYIQQFNTGVVALSGNVLAKLEEQSKDLSETLTQNIYHQTGELCQRIQSLSSSLSSASNILTESFSEQSEKDSVKATTIIAALQECVQYLNETKNGISRIEIKMTNTTKA